MADGGRVGKFPYEIIDDQCLPLRVVLDKSLEMSLQEIGSDRHLKGNAVVVLFAGSPITQNQKVTTGILAQLQGTSCTPVVSSTILRAPGTDARRARQ